MKVIASSPNLEIEVLEPVAGVAPEGQSDVQQAFPSTFGGSRISLKVSSEDVPCTKLRIGVVLSGGQVSNETGFSSEMILLLKTIL